MTQADSITQRTQGIVQRLIDTAVTTPGHWVACGRYVQSDVRGSVGKSCGPFKQEVAEALAALPEVVELAKWALPYAVKGNLHATESLDCCQTTLDRIKALPWPAFERATGLELSREPDGHYTLVAADGEPYFRLSGQAAAQRLDAVAMGRLPALLNAVKRLQEMLEAAIEMCGKAPNRPALLTIKYALAASMSALDQPMDSSPRDSNEITEELVDIWKREYPTQNPDFPRAYVWEEREVPLAQLGGKASVKKARVAEYETLLANGQDLRPLVALDHGIGQLNLLDGYHRRAALTKAKRETATVYVGRLRGAVAN